MLNILDLKSMTNSPGQTSGIGIVKTVSLPYISVYTFHHSISFSGQRSAILTTVSQCGVMLEICCLIIKLQNITKQGCQGHHQAAV